MKAVLPVALAALAACKSAKPESTPAPGSAAETPTPVAVEQPAPAAPAAAAAPAREAAAKPGGPKLPDPSLDACGLGVRSFERLTCKDPADVANVQAGKGAFVNLVDTIRQMSGPPGVGRDQLQILCSQMLLALERDAAALGCTLALDAGDRAKITAAIAAWDAYRTPVAPTGHAVSDDAIARIAAIRDEMCACADIPCLDALAPKLDTISLHDSPPPEARDLMGHLIDDISRCGARIKAATR